MQSVVRCSVGTPFACTAAQHATRLCVPTRPPCRKAQCTVHQLPAVIPRALKDEDAELDRITREANQADVWDNEFIGNGLKIALVAGIVAVAVFIGRLGEPIVENTVKSFPSPAAYEAYEETK